MPQGHQISAGCFESWRARRLSSLTCINCTVFRESCIHLSNDSRNTGARITRSFSCGVYCFHDFRGLLSTRHFHRYVGPLEKLLDDEHLRKFEKFWEVAIDSSKLPDEFLLAPRYDERLMVDLLRTRLLLDFFSQELNSHMSAFEGKIRQEAMNISRDLRLVCDRTLKLAWYKCNNSQKRCVKMSCKDEKSLRRQMQTQYGPSL